MKIHKLNLKTGQYAILAFLFILILSYIGFPRMFLAVMKLLRMKNSVKWWIGIKETDILSY